MEAFICEIVEPRVLDLIVLILPKWRLLIYIFLMNMVMFTPVYAFGVLLISDADLTLICPSAMLVGCNLVHRALFRRHNDSNTRTLLVGVGVLCAGISASGLAALYAPAPVPMVLLLYGVVGGFGYQLVLSKMWKVLAKAFSARKEMFVIKFLHSCGQACSLLLLLAVLHVPWWRQEYVYGALLLVLAGVVLHLVPLALIIEYEKNQLKLDLDSLVQLTEKGNERYYGRVSSVRTGAPLPPQAPEQQQPFELLPVPERFEPGALGASWKNPATFLAPAGQQRSPSGTQGSTKPLTDDDDDDDDDGNDDDEGDSDDDGQQLHARDGKCFTQDGVEILEMILEEDEESVRRAEASERENGEAGSGGDAEETGEHMPPIPEPDTGKWNCLFSQLLRLRLRPPPATTSGDGGSAGHRCLNRRLVRSVKFALLDLRCYGCLLLRATDTCLFVLFLAILPRYTAHQQQQQQQQQPGAGTSAVRLLTIRALGVIATAWAVCSLLLLCCDVRFRKQQERLLIFGILFKSFGYFCVYASLRSSFWTVAGCVLVGLGHSIACAYQDLVIKRQFSAVQWHTAKAGLCLLTGLAVVLLAGTANLLYLHARIDHLLLALLLVYCAAGLFWLACNCRAFFT